MQTLVLTTPGKIIATETTAPGDPGAEVELTVEKGWGVSDIAELLGISGSVPYKERRRTAKGEEMSADEMERLMATLEEEMFAAAEELRFEYAAKLRDEIKDLARDLARLGSARAARKPAVGNGPSSGGR